MPVKAEFTTRQLDGAIARLQTAIDVVKESVAKLSQMEADLAALVRAQQLIEEFNAQDAAEAAAKRSGAGSVSEPTSSDERTLADKIDSVLRDDEPMHADEIVRQLANTNTISNKNTVAGTMLRYEGKRFKRVAPNTFIRFKGNHEMRLGPNHSFLDVDYASQEN